MVREPPHPAGGIAVAHDQCPTGHQRAADIWSLARFVFVGGCFEPDRSGSVQVDRLDLQRHDGCGRVRRRREAVQECPGRADGKWTDALTPWPAVRGAPPDGRRYHGAPGSLREVASAGGVALYGLPELPQRDEMI